MRKARRLAGKEWHRRKAGLLAAVVSTATLYSVSAAAQSSVTLFGLVDRRNDSGQLAESAILSKPVGSHHRLRVGSMGSSARILFTIASALGFRCFSAMSATVW